MAKLCENCGAEVQRLYPFKGKNLCHDCLEKAAAHSVSCPCCGTKVQGEHTVAMLLCRGDAQEEEKARAETAIVLVCPKCHVMFFDPFQYEMLRSRTFK